MTAKKEIKLITDSASDISMKIAEEKGIKILPMNINFGEESLKDGYELTTEEFYNRIRNAKELPKTSQITINDYEKAFREDIDKDIICVCISSKASGGYQNANIAKQMIKDDTPDASITVIDSNTFTYGYGMWLIKAADMVNSGVGKEEIVKYLQDNMNETEIMLTVDSLDYLVKGGRIKSSAKIIANVLDLHPILYTEDGLIMSYAKVRGSKKLVEKLADIVAERIGDNHLVSVLHADCPESVENLKTALSERIPDAEFLTGEVGACIGVHAGPGAFGLIYRKKV